MTRHISNALHLGSLVLCVTTVALWVRSYRYTDAFRNQRVDLGEWAVHRHGVLSANAYLEYFRSDLKFLTREDYVPLLHTRDDYHRGWHLVTRARPGPAGRPTGRLHRRLGFDAVFRWKRAEDSTVNTRILLRVPHWLVAGLFAVAPAAWTVRRVQRSRRDRRVRRGLCPTCGYDLRASTGVCPECGRPVGREVGAGGEHARGVPA